MGGGRALALAKWPRWVISSVVPDSSLSMPVEDILIAIYSSGSVREEVVGILSLECSFFYRYVRILDAVTLSH